MLSMNQGNCAKYESGISSMLDDAKTQLDTALDTKYKDIYKEMHTAGITGPELCNYLDWAYYARVTLKGDMDTWKEIHNTSCKDYSNSVTQANISVEWANDGMISN